MGKKKKKGMTPVLGGHAPFFKAARVSRADSLIS
jgi:hypothetical protein